MAIQEWHQFFEACIRKRLPPDKFRLLFQTFAFQHDSPPGRNLVNVLLNEGQKASTRRSDPRIPLYVREMLQMKVVSTSNVLVATLPLSTANGLATDDGTVDNTANHQHPRTETLLIQMMTLEISNGLIDSKEDLQDVLGTLIKTKYSSANSEALGYFISAILNTPLAQDVLSHISSKSVQTCFLSR